MAESTTTVLIRAPRPTVYAVIADLETLAGCLRPEGTSATILGRDPSGDVLRMQITHGPKPTDNRRFRLTQLQRREHELVVYGAAFEGADPGLTGDMRLHFTLEDAPGGTRVTVRHEGLPPAISSGDNQQGTRSSLANVARLVER